MLTSRYIYRMDDITATMNWSQFWKYTHLFRENGVTPLLGVVPDNRDPKLMVDRENPEFWQTVRDLVAQGLVEIAQHGFQHLYETHAFGLLGRRYGFAQQSEFAGLPYERQLDKIRRGQAILREHGIDTDVWMAPSHSFDAITLRALRDSGFRALTDGIALYPFRRHELLFIPQQLWAPRTLPFGVWTICLHPNTASDGLYEEVQKHLASGAKITSFGESRRIPIRLHQGPVNLVFKSAYLFHIWRYRRRHWSIPSD